MGSGVYGLAKIGFYGRDRSILLPIHKGLSSKNTKLRARIGQLFLTTF